MPQVTVEALVPAVDRHAAFEAARNFERYPELADAVREVVTEDGGVSTWEVSFRDGILRWQERDSFDEEAGRIAFDLVDGDFKSFSGEWVVSEHPRGVRVRFAADFDLGIPSLAALIDPLAERTLYRNIASIIEGLFGPSTEVVSDEPAEQLKQRSTEGAMPALAS